MWKNLIALQQLPTAPIEPCCALMKRNEASFWRRQELCPNMNSTGATGEALTHDMLDDSKMGKELTIMISPLYYHLR